MAAENKTVARAQRKAQRFAEIARQNPRNVIVTEEVKDERLMSFSNLKRTFTVKVEDNIGFVTTAAWTVDVEQPSYGRRSIRFFGWSYSGFTKGKRVSEDLARIRVTN